MVDLGRPDHFGDSQGVVEPILIGDRLGGGAGATEQLELFTTDESASLYRVRFVAIRGQATAAPGGFVLTFQGLTSALVGNPWPSGGPLVAASETEVLANEGFHFTWSTEVADNYSNLDGDFGRIWVGGLPLLYLPKLTTFSVLFTPKAGYNGDYHIIGGHMQLERFQADAVTGKGADLAEIYLLPVAQ